MGHQYFERLSGEFIQAFQMEMEQPVVDPRRAADSGVKAVFNRVVALHAAKDLQRAIGAAAAVQLPPGTTERAAVLAAVVSKGFVKLRHTCTYPDEAEHIALALVRAAHSSLVPTKPTLPDAFRAASSFFANQVCRSEAVFRVVRDGPDSMDTLARGVAKEMAGRAEQHLTKKSARNQGGFGSRDWRAPRAKSPRRTNTETGGVDVS